MFPHSEQACRSEGAVCICLQATINISAPHGALEQSFGLLEILSVQATLSLRDLSQHIAQLREVYRFGQMIIKAGIASAHDIVVLVVCRQRHARELLAAFRFTNHIASAAVR